MPAEPEESTAEPTIESFLGETTHEISDWRWLWRVDRPFPLRSHRPGILGRVVVAIKRLVRPVVRAPQADLWDRQRVFNLVLLSHLDNLYRVFDELGRDLQHVQEEILCDLREVQSEFIRDATNLVERIEPLEEFKRRGMKDLMLHSDALFSRLDQKLDRVRRKVEAYREGNA